MIAAPVNFILNDRRVGFFLVIGYIQAMDVYNEGAGLRRKRDWGRPGRLKTLYKGLGR